MRKVLVTGGAGFFGGILERVLVAQGFAVVGLDLLPHPEPQPGVTAVQGDLRDSARLDALFAEHRFAGVFHCAAILAHAVKDEQLLWSSNVEGTRNLADAMERHGVRPIVFTSSNCLWGRGYGRPLTEDEPPAPIEVYGRSKWEGEKVLWERRETLDVTIIRCPTIIDSGRLGLLAILFEFIDEGRRIWVVGRGDNRYQFIYAPDLADACIRALDHPGSHLFHIGSDDVKSFSEVFGHVAERAGTGARIAHLPRRPTLAAMRLAHVLGLSPLGPYHYRMIAESFEFDTSRIKGALGWRPTRTNEEMLLDAYRYYHENRERLARETSLSAHRKASPMGVIRLLKWLS
jgi:UDP-glucose 4-epimerase